MLEKEEKKDMPSVHQLVIKTVGVVVVIGRIVLE